MGPNCVRFVERRTSPRDVASREFQGSSIDSTLLLSVVSL